MAQGFIATAFQKICQTGNWPHLLGPLTAGGIVPFPYRLVSHVISGAAYLPSTPLKLVYSVLHSLVMSHRGCSPRRVASPSSAGRGLIFVDAAFDVDRFKVGVLGPALGGRVFRFHPDVATQQEAK